MKGQWVALVIRSKVQYLNFRSFGTLSAVGTRVQKGHDRGTRGALMGTKGDTVFVILTHLRHRRQRGTRGALEGHERFIA